MVGKDPFDKSNRTPYTSWRAQREAAEREALAQMAKGTPERAVRASDVSTVDPTKRWRTGEEEKHSEYTYVINYASSYLKDALPQTLAKLEEHLAKTDLNWTIYPNPKSVKRLIAATLEKRKMLELKKIFLMSKTLEGEKSLEQYFKEKTPEERYHTMVSMQAYFKDALKSVSDKDGVKTREEINSLKESKADKLILMYNKILRAYRMRVIKLPHVEFPNQDNVVVQYANFYKVARASHCGYFTLPTPEDTDEGKDNGTWLGKGYSPQYEAFADPHKRGKLGTVSAEPIPDDYSWTHNRAIRAIMHSSNAARMLPQIKYACAQQRVPLEVLENATVSDIAHILYKQYSPDDNSIGNPRYNDPDKAHKIYFKDVNSRCDLGTMGQLFREIAQDEGKLKEISDQLIAAGKLANPDVDYTQYAHDVIENIKNNYSATIANSNNPEVYPQPTPKLSVHHDEVYLCQVAQMSTLVDLAIEEKNQWACDELKRITGHDDLAETNKEYGKIDFDKITAKELVIGLVRTKEEQEAKQNKPEKYIYGARYVHDDYLHGIDTSIGQVSYRMCNTSFDYGFRVYLTSGDGSDEVERIEEKSPGQKYLNLAVKSTTDKEF